MSVRILMGDCRGLLKTLPDESVHCVVSSPPYWGLRDYGVAGQIGLEAGYAEYIAELVGVFREVRRVLRADGTLWLNLGDSYSSHAAGKCAEPMKTSSLAGVKTQEIGRATKQAQAYRNSALPEKNLVGIPWRVAFALQEDGWYLRQDIIWAKPNPMPESVTDRCTRSHEHIFMLSKSARYYYDAEAIAEESAFGAYLHSPYAPPGQAAHRGNVRDGNGKHSDKQRGHSRRHAGFNERWDQMTREEQCSGMRNKRDVWTVATQPYSEAHFATFPPALIEPCILAGCPMGGTVLDPFGGAGTTGLVADRLGRNAILLELNPEYAAMAKRRLEADAGLFADVA